ncbi:hypothetical protein GCM10009682_21410 [Luedemannella flava]|uniref:Uncharacterized protein n=1 Tax=Luedemannella flava TaxID=349316 RepID=A0ABP4Y3D1_9ACTN
MLRLRRAQLEEQLSADAARLAGIEARLPWRLSQLMMASPTRRPRPARNCRTRRELPGSGWPGGVSAPAAASIDVA